MDGGSGEFEAFGGSPVGAGGDAAGAGLGVDDPDGFDAHGAVILATLFEVGVGVVGGEDFDDEERRFGEDFLLRAGAEDDDVGDADAVGRYADALLRTADDVPHCFVDHEPSGQKPLQS